MMDSTCVISSFDCPRPDHRPLYGFFEGKVSRSKTAYTTERKTMNSPMVGPRRGVSGRDWVGAGLELRKRLPIPMSEGNPLLPAPTRAGWQQVPLGAGQAGAWLRSILKMLGESNQSVSNIGTHSCKTTALSWLAKAGIPLESRRILGMHTTPGEQTPLVYSRDALSGPLLGWSRRLLCTWIVYGLILVHSTSYKSTSKLPKQAY